MKFHLIDKVMMYAMGQARRGDNDDSHLTYLLAYTGLPSAILWLIYNHFILLSSILEIFQSNVHQPCFYHLSFAEPAKTTLLPWKSGISLCPNTNAFYRRLFSVRLVVLLASWPVLILTEHLPAHCTFFSRLRATHWYEGWWIVNEYPSTPSPSLPLLFLISAQECSWTKPSHTSKKQTNKLRVKVGGEKTVCENITFCPQHDILMQHNMKLFTSSLFLTRWNLAPVQFCYYETCLWHQSCWLCLMSMTSVYTNIL